MAMVNILAKHAKAIIAIKPDSPLALFPSDILQCVKNNGIIKKTAVSMNEAIRDAGKLCMKKDIICITGSLVTAGEALKILDLN